MQNRIDRIISLIGWNLIIFDNSVAVLVYLIWRLRHADVDFVIFQQSTLPSWGLRRVQCYRKLEFSMTLSWMPGDVHRYFFLLFANQFKHGFCEFVLNNQHFYFLLFTFLGYHEAPVSSESGRDIYKG